MPLESLLKVAEGSPGHAWIVSNIYKIRNSEGESLRRLEKAAELGGAEARFHLAAAYWKGDVVPEDEAGTVGWIEASAEAGEAWAQYVLHRLYAEGEGVPHDEAKSLEWLEKSAR